MKVTADMYPARFIPLYELAKLYDVTGCRNEVLAMAKKIIDKGVKVPSPAITAIKTKCENGWKRRNW